jgi:adenosylcobinamide-GDP ribazoletransferase
VSIRSLRAAMSFLTVLPVANADGSAGERLGRAYFPAVGALVGLAAGIAFVVTAAATTPLLGAAVAVAVLSALTGAIHLDGLADTADGLLTHGDVERRLAVMREPALGSYGVTAIVAVLVLEVAALASIPAGRAVVALVIAGAISRLATLPVIAFVPYVRSVRRPPSSYPCWTGGARCSRCRWRCSSRQCSRSSPGAGSAARLATCAARWPSCARWPRWSCSRCTSDSPD